MKQIIFIFLFFISTFSSVAQPTFKDVAPIFYSRCTSCHNQYTHGASLLNYSQVNAKISTIRAYLNSGYMPPWHPDTSYTHFVDEHAITQTEKAAILNWITRGALKGDTTLAPPIPVYSRYQLAGTADLELKIPTFVSNANGTDSHVTFALPTRLTQDRIIRAFEIVAGNASIVHHVVASIDTSGTQITDTSGACFPITNNVILGGYAPGANPCIYPNSSSLRIGTTVAAGSNIMLNIHYPAGTLGQVDSTKIRIYFYPTNVLGVRNIQRVAVHNNSLNIPANTITTFTAQFPANGGIRNTMSVFSVFPHSHHLCKSILSYAYTVADTIPLIKINKWDFDFQGYYTFRRLVKITPPHILFAQHVFDNTNQNADNPNSPPANVSFGPNTANEMMVDSYQCLEYRSGDEFINVDSILANDPLAIASIKQTQFLVKNINNYAFPNPFQQNVNIGYTLDRVSQVSVSIYNSEGVRVKAFSADNETEGLHEKIWDGKNNQGQKLSSGNYFYIIRVDDKSCAGKIILLP